MAGKAEWDRIYGSPERIAWVRSLGCALGCGGDAENAHTATGGMGRKADAETIVSLCSRHHRELHQYGRRTFEQRYGIDLAEAAAFIAAWWAEKSAARDAR